MLTYVKSGETVKASTVNSLIDAVGGEQNPSPDLGFVNTQNGTQFTLPTSMKGLNGPVPVLFQGAAYMHSGWPFMQYQLGHTQEDCLAGIKLHDYDGKVYNTISAAQIWHNSLSCPTGDTLSGAWIGGFGENAVIHDDGFVKTLIEFPSAPESPRSRLQLWQIDEDIERSMMVITNEPDENNVGAQLSTMIIENGDSLSSAEMISEWSLFDMDSLPIPGIGTEPTMVPSKPTQHKTGIIDYFFTKDFMYSVLMKSDFVCYERIDNDDGTLYKSSWCWKIWFGPDSTYIETSDGNFIHAPAFTQGGDDIVVRVAGRIGSIAAYQNGTFALND